MARVRQATAQYPPPLPTFAGMGCMPHGEHRAPYLPQQEMWNSVHDLASCEGLQHIQPEGYRKPEFWKPSIPDSDKPMWVQVETRDSLDDLYGVSYFADEPGNITSKEEWLNSPLHVFPNLSNKSNRMTSRSLDQASHVMSNSGNDFMNQFVAKTFSDLSETFVDEVDWNQSTDQSSNGSSSPASGMHMDATSKTMPTVSVHTFGEKAAVRQEGITTLMIRNLPRTSCPVMVANELERSGFAGCFDFVYVPSVFKHDQGKSFAFVNFINTDMASKFACEWTRSWRFEAVGQRTKVNVVTARIQGLQANVAKWGERALVRVRTPHFRPLMPEGLNP